MSDTKWDKYKHIDTLLWGGIILFLGIIGQLFLEINNNFEFILWMFGLILIIVFIYVLCSFKEIHRRFRIPKFDNRVLSKQFEIFYGLFLLIWLIWLYHFYTKFPEEFTCFILIFSILSIIPIILFYYFGVYKTK